MRIREELEEEEEEIEMNDSHCYYLPAEVRAPSCPLLPKSSGFVIW